MTENDLEMALRSIAHTYLRQHEAAKTQVRRQLEGNFVSVDALRRIATAQSLANVGRHVIRELTNSAAPTEVVLHSIRDDYREFLLGWAPTSDNGMEWVVDSARANARRRFLVDTAGLL